MNKDAIGGILFWGILMPSPILIGLVILLRGIFFEKKKR